MNSLKTPTILTPSSDLVTQLQRLRLLRTAESLDDLLARAATQHWSPRQLLEEVARTETQDLAAAAWNAVWPRPAWAASNPWRTSNGAGPRKSIAP